MATAFFPGKFQPIHVGHVITLMSLYEKYDRIIVGITDDFPQVLSQNEKKEIFELIFKYLPKYDFVLIKEIITNSKDLSYLPKFDVCLTGNEKVIKTMTDLGLNAQFLERSKGIGYSGTEIRTLIEKSND